MLENRAQKRAEVETEVRIRSHSLADFIAEHSHDLSIGGVFIATSEPMAKHTLVKLEIVVDDAQEPIRAVGRIIWTRTPEEATASAPAGMGIKFVKIDEAERTRIADLVEKAGEGAGSRAPREDEEASPSDLPPKPPADAELAEPETAAEAKPETATEAKPGPEAEAAAEPGAEPEAEPEPETKPEAKAEAEPEKAEAPESDEEPDEGEEDEEDETDSPDLRASPDSREGEKEPAEGRTSTPSPGKKKKTKKERKEEARLRKTEKKKAVTSEPARASGASPAPSKKAEPKASTKTEPKRAPEPEQGGFPVWVIPVALAVVAAIAWFVWGR